MSWTGAFTRALGLKGGRPSSTGAGAGERGARRRCHARGAGPGAGGGGALDARGAVAG